MPTEYIHFTEEQKQQARQTDLVALLQSQGEHLKRSGKEYVWRDGSDKVTVRGNLWFHQYERIGGDAVDFVRRFYNMDFPQAVNFLLGNNGGALPQAEPVKREPPKPFTLPLKNDNMRRVYAYLLNRRGIDREVLSAFVHKGMIYESADYHNAVFVGYDEHGIARHAHKRGTGSESTYKGNAESCDPRYSFHWTGTDNALYLFEAPIDMLDMTEIDKAVLRSKMTECLARKYKELGNGCCAVQRLKAELGSTADIAERLNRAVSEIRLYTDKTADIILLNGQIIRKESDNGTDCCIPAESGADNRTDRIGQRNRENPLPSPAGGGILPRFH